MVDGNYFPPDKDAALSPGVLRAPGVFETVLIYKGRPVFLPQHLARLKKGLRYFDLRLPVPWPELSRSTQEIISAGGMRSGRLRLSVWRSLRRTHWALAARPGTGYSAADAGRGFFCAIARQRIRASQHPGYVKALRYQPYAAALRQARVNGRDEALLLNEEGLLCEGSRTNIFWLRDGCLYTPHSSTGCLEGVVRKEILRLARARRVRVRQVRVGPEVLRRADAVFVTNSLLGLMPVARIGKDLLPRFDREGILKALGQDYQRQVEISAGSKV